MKEIDRHTYGPWALVTGASSGIGEGFARQAAANGLNVVLVARREERLKELGAELTTRYGVEAHALPLDLADEAAFNAIVEGTDGLDIGLVISNAGAGNPGPFISLPHDKLREIVRLNVFAHLDLAHHFGKKLAERGHGGLVLVSAVAAAGRLPYMANDSATKAYVLNLGEALHVELRQAGVNVTVLVNTPVVARIGLNKIGLPAEAISPEQGSRRGTDSAPGKSGDHSHASPHERSIRRHEGSRLRDDHNATRGRSTRPLGLRQTRQSMTPKVIEGDKLKYMLQVRFNGADAVIHELPADEQEKVTAEFIAIRKSADVLDGNQLEAASSGVTVRVHAGQTQVTDGPAVDAGSELDGYYIYDAPDLDAATAFAARIPVTRMGGSVEVRTMVER